MVRHTLWSITWILITVVGCAPDIVILGEGDTATLLDSEAVDDAGGDGPSSDTQASTDTPPTDTSTAADGSSRTDTSDTPCDSAAECASTPCIVGVCTEGKCAYQALIDGAPCQPKDLCFSPGTCEAGECISAPVDCDDSDDCTNDTCAEGVCTNTMICCSGTGPCDDGNPSTKDDLCNGDGVCTGTLIECPPTTTCILEYQPNGTDCTPTYALAGTTCDDTNPMTEGDSCNGWGECKGSSPNCPVPTSCISEYISDGAVCVALNTPSGTPCSDGDETTENDECDGAGSCAGTPIVCPQVSACISAWSITDETCLPTYAPAGTSCDDGDVATKNDVCDATGSCNGLPIECSAPPQCVDSYATDGEGCVAQYTTAGADCDDGDPATSNDVCNGAGNCAGSPFGCPGPTQCTPEWNPDGEGCNPIHATASTECNDGDNGTMDDTCDGAGNCVGIPIECPTTTDCITSYSPNGSICIPTYANSGASCDDGSSSTKDDECNGVGTCIGVPYSCPASTACVTGYSQNGVTCVPVYASSDTVCSTASGVCKEPGTCDGSGTCQPETAKPDGTACGSTSTSPCDLPDTCLSGQCAANYAPSGTTCLASTNECVLDSTCNGSGVCSPGENLPNGGPCGSSDDTACTNPDTCQNGNCEANNEAPGTICAVSQNECVKDSTCNNDGVCESGANKLNGTACGSNADTACSNPDSCFDGSCNGNHEPGGTICGTASNDCRNPEKCSSSGTCLPETSKVNGSSCGSGAKTSCTDPDTCLNGECSDNHVVDGTSCGSVTSDCTIPQCSNGACAGSGTAPEGSICPISFNNGQTPSDLCGTCTNATCQQQQGQNGFCHDGQSNTICDNTLFLTCLPCPAGSSPCILDVPIIPIP